MTTTENMKVVRKKSSVFNQHVCVQILDYEMVNEIFRRLIMISKPVIITQAN